MDLRDGTKTRKLNYFYRDAKQGRSVLILLNTVNIFWGTFVMYRTSAAPQKPLHLVLPAQMETRPGTDRFDSGLCFSK